jgi:hypothetical protein
MPGKRRQQALEDQIVTMAPDQNPSTASTSMGNLGHRNADAVVHQFSKEKMRAAPPAAPGNTTISVRIRYVEYSTIKQ